MAETPAPVNQAGIHPLIIGAGDASPNTPVKVYLQAGRTQGLTEIGTLYYPAQLPSLLRDIAGKIEMERAE